MSIYEFASYDQNVTASDGFMLFLTPSHVLKFEERD